MGIHIVLSDAAAKARAVPRRRWLLMVPMFVVIGVAIIGPYVVPYNPVSVVGSPGQGPSSKFLLGTDSFGLDIFSRTIVATRLDVWIGVAVAVLASATGAAAGVATGMAEHRRDLLGASARLIARGMELVSALPSILVALAVVSIVGGSETAMIVTISATLTPNLMRLVRTEVLKVRQDAYLDAARQAGLGELRIMVRHVIPNSAWPVIETFSLTFGSAIVTTAALGFLGIGIPVPTPEWGSMIATGVTDVVFGRWWTTVIPSAAMAFTVTSIALATRPLGPSRLSPLPGRTRLDAIWLSGPSS